MAFIYRYQLKDSKLRDNVRLKNYEDEILSVLRVLFEKNLKESFVNEKDFEFKLYTSVVPRALQDMGRKLKSILHIFPSSNKNGFVRMEQTLYACVYFDSNNSLLDNTIDTADIEFIDSSVINNKEEFLKRAFHFFEKSENRNIYNESNDSRLYQSIIKNYYIDVFGGSVKKYSYPDFFYEIKELNVFLVKGYHRRISDTNFEAQKTTSDRLVAIERCLDVEYMNNQDLYTSNVNNNLINIDFFKITSIEKRPELVEQIKQELELYISSTEEIMSLNDISNKMNMISGKKKFEFKTYNVGQAHASSISLLNSDPFLYFDYGIPCGNNLKTRPSNINMVTNPGITIIISHLHKDHWLRIADDLNAYKCHWYIPNQPRSVKLNHKLAEIISSGGTVLTIDADIFSPFGRITCGGQSKLNPHRSASHVHETGLTLRINASDEEGEELNILVAGDQCYDYVEDTQLDNLDILIASHHGGTFCRTTSGRVPIAKVSENSMIIYSYGSHNTYGHPSKIGEYSHSNWMNEHHTCIHGDFSIKILK